MEMQDLETKRAWIALQRVPGVGPVSQKRLIERFGNPENIWLAKPRDFEQLSWLSAKARIALAGGPDDIQTAEDIECLGRLGAWVVTIDDPWYPPLLREIYAPPHILYGVGDKGALLASGIAMVGSRRASRYGMMMARSLARTVSRAGLSVISGLAPGVDTVCHETVSDDGGITVGVKGCGLDVQYPRENVGLERRMVMKGAVVSEFPLGTEPEPRNFPIRNRIISGMSRGVLVVEAGLKSGSLITASYALDQGRSVMAIPGPVTSSLSAGTNWLIKQGARLVESVEDILDELRITDRRSAVAPAGRDGEAVTGDDGLRGLSKEEHAVYEKLGHDPVHLDDLVHCCALPVSLVSGLLMRLALKELVQILPGQFYQRKE